VEYRRLGRSGLKLSALSYGAWVTFARQVDVSSAEEFLRVAYDAGVNFFDNAEGYEHGEAERVMGAALRRLGFPRDSFCVSSKVFFGAARDPWPTQRGLSRKHVIEACEQALRRLGVDYLDLYFCHRADPETPIEETVRAMHDLVAQGKVLYWGTSEWSADQILEAARVAREQHLVGPTMEQPQYNLLERRRVENEYAPVFRELGLGATTWSPLASGLLTGKYLDGIPAGSRLDLPGYEWLRRSVEGERGARRLARVRRLAAVADDLGTSLARLSIAWCLRNPDVSTVILGASRASQLAENLRALEVLPQLDDGVLRRIDAALAREPG
jgi:voltage-dependent potassium channel beta subunit